MSQVSPKRTKKLALSLVPVFAMLLSCDQTDSVTKFCSSAVAALSTGDAIFDDMKASCVREAAMREPFGTFRLSDPDAAVCTNIGDQAAGLKAASQILASYFTAVNELAAFGTSKAGDKAQDLLTKASSQGKLSTGTQKALGAIAGLLTHAATSGYQRKRLADEISTVHEDIRAVLDGLGAAVGIVYLHQLQNEEKKTATRYQEFVLEHPQAVDSLIVLDSRWQSDRAGFEAKQKAAQNYKLALDTLAKGNEDLATHARRLNAKQLAGRLSPYASRLTSLVPAIQQAFF